jgi:hypothetical protein
VLCGEEKLAKLEEEKNEFQLILRWRRRLGT